MKRGPFPLSLRFDDLYSVEISASPRPEAVRREILDFWHAEQALPPAVNPETREPHVIALARHRASGAVTGIGSAISSRLPQIHSHVWQFRTYVSREHRKYELASRLAEITRDHLNQNFVRALTAGENPAEIGMYIVFESEILHKTNNFAVLPATQLVYIGPNALGMRQYIFYFDDARVAVRPVAGVRG